MKTLAVFVILALLPTVAEAQEAGPTERPFLSLEAVDIGGGLSFGLARKPGILSVNGYSTVAEVRARLTETYFLSVGAGYGRLSVDEQDPITTWNWAYWNRLYRNYIVLWLGSDSAYNDGRLQSLRSISNTRLTTGRWTGKDSIYSVQMTPQQYINTYPISVTVGARLQPLEGVEVSGGVTLMVVPFERNLYLDESWSKRRKVDTGPDSGSYYVFNYGFRNFANSRRGTAWGAGVSAMSSVDLGGGFTAFATIRFVQFTSGIRPDSYAVLPVERLLAFGAGVRVVY